MRHLFFTPIMLPLLHTISGWLIIIAFAAKILLHFWLDKQQQPSLGLIAILLVPNIYFGKYKAAVVAKYQTHKNICNFCWYITLIALLSNIAIGLVQLYTMY